MLQKSKNFFLDLFFPKFCLGCQKEIDYLCQDCQAILEISSNHRVFKTEYLEDLYFATHYQNFLLKKLIQKFKYPPFIKELAKPLSSLIIDHFQLIENPPPFLEKKDWVFVSIPLEKRKLKCRGFNQAEEIAIELSKSLKIPFLKNVISKERETRAQVELSEKERKENLKNCFSLKRPKEILDRKILLVDDIYTTGQTMGEAAKILKEGGAKEIIGIVIAKARPGQDYFKLNL
jgi:ComF family protein